MDKQELRHTLELRMHKGAHVRHKQEQVFLLKWGEDEYFI